MKILAFLAAVWLLPTAICTYAEDAVEPTDAPAASEAPAASDEPLAAVEEAIAPGPAAAPEASAAPDSMTTSEGQNAPVADAPAGEEIDEVVQSDADQSEENLPEADDASPSDSSLAQAEPTDPAPEETMDNVTEELDVVDDSESENARELDQIQMRLEEVSERITAAHQEATRQPAVKEALLEYERKLAAAMIELAPEQQEQIERKLQIVEELVEMDDYMDLPAPERQKFQQLIEEHQTLRADLVDLELRAAQTEDATEALREVSRLQIEEMAKIDPEIEDLGRLQMELKLQAETLSEVQHP